MKDTGSPLFVLVIVVSLWKRALIHCVHINRITSVSPRSRESWDCSKKTTTPNAGLKPLVLRTGRFGDFAEAGENIKNKSKENTFFFFCLLFVFVFP